VIVALIEAGLRPGQAVRLQDPLGAMRRFSLDDFLDRFNIDRYSGYGGGGPFGPLA
jgi:hypothetical protein